MIIKKKTQGLSNQASLPSATTTTTTTTTSPTNTPIQLAVETPTVASNVISTNDVKINTTNEKSNGLSALINRPSKPSVGIGLDSCVIPLRHAGLNLIQTTDFFYPLIEDPYNMGKIACANVLSDLYAMGVTECDNMLMVRKERRV